MRYRVTGLILLVGLLTIMFVGCSRDVALRSPNSLPKPIRDALEQADKWELYSLDPDDSKDYPDGFHNFRILGTMTIQNGETRNRLFAALKQAIPSHNEAVAACFWPRHGIRVPHNNKNHDVVICFQCSQIQTYIDDQPAGNCEVNESPEPLLTDLLRHAGIPLPEPPNQ